jgi:hypothetical protein
MARRLVVFDSRNEIEIVGFQDERGEMNFRPPRKPFHWQTGDIFDYSKGKRHRGRSPTDEDLRRSRNFIIRYRVDGEDYYRHFASTTGIGPLTRVSGERMFAEFKSTPPPKPGEPQKS